MAGDGKFHHDSGRSRFMRFRDRAQGEWDDMLIGDFLRSQHGGRDGGLDFGQLDFAALFEHEDTPDPRSSESAIANAMLEAGVFEENLFDDALPVEQTFDVTLFDALANEERKAIAAPLTTSQAVKPLTLRRSARAQEVAAAGAGASTSFSLRGFVQGFLIGAVFAGAVLLTLRVLI
jgi:hypothetical protein